MDQESVMGREAGPAEGQGLGDAGLQRCGRVQVALDEDDATRRPGRINRPREPVEKAALR